MVNLLANLSPKKQAQYVHWNYKVKQPVDNVHQVLIGIHITGLKINLQVTCGQSQSKTQHNTHKTDTAQYAAFKHMADNSNSSNISDNQGNITSRI